MNYGNSGLDYFQIKSNHIQDFTINNPDFMIKCIEFSNENDYIYNNNYYRFIEQNFLIDMLGTLINISKITKENKDTFVKYIQKYKLEGNYSGYESPDKELILNKIFNI